MEEEYIEGIERDDLDIYTVSEDLLDDDEITLGEYGFMVGYMA